MAAPLPFCSIEGMLGDERYADLTVTCGGKTFRLHRAIMCAQSEFFAKACSGGFQEAQTGVIDLPEDDPHIFEKFVQLAYTGTLTIESIDGNTSHTFQKVSLDLLEQRQQAYQGLIGSVCRGDPLEVPVGADPKTTKSDLTPQHSMSPLSDTEVKSFKRIICYAELLMVSAVRLYIMADKLVAPTIKLLSLHNFEIAAVTFMINEIEGDFIPAVIDELYDNTTSTDVALKEMLCRLVLFRREQRGPTDLWTQIQPMMRKHGEFAAQVLNYLNDMTVTFSVRRWAESEQGICMHRCTCVRGECKCTNPAREKIDGDGKCRCTYCGNKHRTMIAPKYDANKSLEWMKRQRDLALVDGQS